MSGSTPATPAPGGHGSEKEKTWLEKAVYWGKIIFIAIGVIFLLWLFVPSGNSSENSTGNTSSGQTNNGNTNSQQQFSAPTHDDQIVEINGEYPNDFTYCSSGFDMQFCCGHDYKIINSYGKEFEGKANQDVDIGVSDGNKALKFKTLDGSQTKMTIKYVFDPTKVKN